MRPDARTSPATSKACAGAIVPRPTRPSGLTKSSGPSGRSVPAAGTLDAVTQSPGLAASSIAGEHAAWKGPCARVARTGWRLAPAARGRVHSSIVRAFIASLRSPWDRRMPARAGPTEAPDPRAAAGVGGSRTEAAAALPRFAREAPASVVFVLLEAQALAV